VYRGESGGVIAHQSSQFILKDKATRIMLKLLIPLSVEKPNRFVWFSKRQRLPAVRIRNNCNYKKKKKKKIVI